MIDVCLSVCHFCWFHLISQWKYNECRRYKCPDSCVKIIHEYNLSCFLSFCCNSDDVHKTLLLPFCHHLRMMCRKSCLFPPVVLHQSLWKHKCFPCVSNGESLTHKGRPKSDWDLNKVHILLLVQYMINISGQKIEQLIILLLLMDTRRRGRMSLETSFSHCICTHLPSAFNPSDTYTVHNQPPRSGWV